MNSYILYSKMKILRFNVNISKKFLIKRLFVFEKNCNYYYVLMFKIFIIIGVFFFMLLIFIVVLYFYIFNFKM